MSVAPQVPLYPLVCDGTAVAALVVGADADPFRHWLATELRRGLRQLTGVDVPVTTDMALPEAGVLLAVGGPAANPLAARAADACGCDFGQLPAEGYWLRTGHVDGRLVVLCGGNDDRGDMYGAYALLEVLGLVFELTGDVVPEPRPDLAVPELEQRAVPAQRHRGLMYYDLLMPWAGLAEFTALLDQMAKLRLNRLMFFFYTGAPWVSFSYQGEPALIGDLYTPESGYRTLRMNTQTYEAADMPIGAEAFGRRRVGSAEFQDCQTPQAAQAAAQQVLQQVITHAHARRIEVWLAAGDCPGTHPNLARHARDVSCWTTQCGLVIAPGDPVGLGVWEALMTALIDTYPEADRYVVGLAEWAMDASHPGTRTIIDRYAHLRSLIPSVEHLRQLGYDYADPPYNYRDEALRDSELVLLHYGRELTERLRQSRPQAALGLYVLGRAFMFRALDAAVAPGVVFASMEASICWNRRTRRLPVELFGGLGPREAIVVPRLDDGESGFGMQFNAALFANDRIFGDAAASAPSGTIAALGGRLHGVEANARCLADAGWDLQVRPRSFYVGYAARLAGPAAAPALATAFDLLEEHEMFIGLEAECIPEAGMFFLGMGNFTDWTLSKDIGHMGAFRRLRNPMAGPDDAHWSSVSAALPAWLRESAYRRERYAQGLVLLRQAHEQLEVARRQCAAGAAPRLAYLAFRTGLYIDHLETIRLLLASYLAYDAAFRLRRGGDEEAFADRLRAFADDFAAALRLARATTRALAAGSGSATDRYLLFRYSVLWLRPLEAFAVFVGNITAFHRGAPYWAHVDWAATEIARLPYENV
jgi:hypothetical protein